MVELENEKMTEWVSGGEGEGEEEKVRERENVSFCIPNEDNLFHIIEIDKLSWWHENCKLKIKRPIPCEIRFWPKNEENEAKVCVSENWRKEIERDRSSEKEAKRKTKRENEKDEEER